MPESTQVGNKEKVTFLVPAELMLKLRMQAAGAWGPKQTQSAIVEEALTRYLEQRNGKSKRKAA